MSREDQILQWIRRGLRPFAGELDGYRVVLFGSRARRDQRRTSDFDIGIFGKAPVPLKTFYKIDTFLEELPTLYRIDWVDLDRASPSVRKEALQNAEVLYE